MKSRDGRPRGFPKSVGVIGGGTAGHFAALALKRRFPDLDVTIVESSAVPIIGVGEATTTLMPPFLHRTLGLSIVDLFRAVRPTFKMGIKFLWGPAAADHVTHFTYPFGEAWPVEAFALEGDLRSQSLASMLMDGGQAPMVRAPDGSLLALLRSVKFAYHLDNAPFVAHLASHADLRGIARVDATLATIRRSPDGQDVTSLLATDGRELAFDLYVDATGFRSLLTEGRSPFLDYGSSLFCDRAIVATVPQRGAIDPFTTAETMDAGWCWTIPVEGEDHRGYVHASAFLDEAAAEAEMRARNPTMGEARVVRFRSGRQRDFWIGNTVAIGNAYGFVEPLESTALHMIILELAYVMAGLEALEKGDDPASFVPTMNRSVGAHWDYLRWFLAVHYKFNGRRDTPFWRAARADVDVSGVAELLARFRSEGPWILAEGARFAVSDPAFGYAGLMMLLLGQRAEGSERARTSTDRAAWERKIARYRGVAARALSHRETLDALREDPAMLLDFVDASTSWCRVEAGIPAALAGGAMGT